MSNLSPYYLACSECRLCEGSAYQMPPFLYAGSDKPSVLVIAQNPGEIKGDEWRLKIADYSFKVKTAESLKTTYEIDFFTSSGCTTMGKIFGENWLLSGKFMYTNAVRCRTPDNKMPSDTMALNCAGWTAQLPTPPVVVLMGRMAVSQFCTMVKKPELKPWKMAKLKKGRETVYVLAIPHYVAMKGHDDLNTAKELFEEALEMADIK